MEKAKTCSQHANVKKSEKDEKKTEQKVFCKYCKQHGHDVKDCPKIAAKEAKNKEANMATDVSASNAESVNYARDAQWEFIVQCPYDPLVYNSCISVATDSHVWFFDSGATKHITSQRSLFKIGRAHV